MCRRLCQQVSRFPNLELGELDAMGLSHADQALAHALYDAVIRRWLTLRCVLGHCLDQPFDRLEPSVRAVLLSGAAQLLLLDRIPTHAAINESVEWIKRQGSHKAGGLVNAVLRRVSQLMGERVAFSPGEDLAQNILLLSDGRAIELKADVFGAEPLHLLAASTSHPVELIRNWWDRWNLDRARQLALHSLARPVTILNTSYASSPVPEELIEVHDEPGHHVFKGSMQELTGLLTQRDDVWVQDPSSSAAIGSRQQENVRTILDLCAGLGTKTRQLAQHYPDAQIFATDIHPGRLRTLQQVFGEHERVNVVLWEGIDDAINAINGVDLVLVDVPCSNTGVLARRPEARYRASRDQQQRLVKTQQEILERAARLCCEGDGKLGVRGGRVVYATCSIEKPENEEMAAWVGKSLGRKARDLKLRLPCGIAGGRAGGYRDGSFSMVIE